VQRIRSIFGKRRKSFDLCDFVAVGLVVGSAVGLGVGLDEVAAVAEYSEEEQVGEDSEEAQVGEDSEEAQAMVVVAPNQRPVRAVRHLTYLYPLASSR
jgi:hypothetical protein